MAGAAKAFYRALFRIWRRKRHAVFVDRIRPKAGTTMLDVGGVAGYWTALDPMPNAVDMVNPSPDPWAQKDFPRHRLCSHVANGCALPFLDRSYDVVFSNSVIEHVGDWQTQKRFASEIRRVGRALWVQTPAYEFPFEPHYLAPLVQYLPERLRLFVARWLCPRSLIDAEFRAGAAEFCRSTRLLTRREFGELFPDCEILTERFLGWPKSYVAFRSVVAMCPQVSQVAGLNRSSIAVPSAMF